MSEYPKDILKSVEQKCLGDIDVLFRENEDGTVIFLCPKCNNPLTPSFTEDSHYTFLLQCNNCNDGLAYVQNFFKFLKNGKVIKVIEKPPVSCI